MIIMEEVVEILRGDTYEHTFYVMDNDGSVINLAGYEVYSVAVDKPGDIKIVLDIGQYMDMELMAANGVILLSIPATVTDNIIKSRAVFDVKVKHTITGKVSTVAVGTVSVSDTISRAI